MLVYRFRLISEDHDNLIRDFEILPGQTFLDFHAVILESTELTFCKKASFFITDKKYKKDREISLKSEKRQIRKYDEDLDEMVSLTIVPPLMKKSKLKDYIEDPHQKIIYEFQGNEFYSFHIELFKIVQTDGSWSYPRCVKKTGELPKKPELPPPPVPEPVAAPKNILPKIQIPKLTEVPKPEKTVDDEIDLTGIDNQLSEILEEEAPVIAAREVTAEDDEIFDDEEEGGEHIENYDDIENLERKYSGYGSDTDDY